MGKSHTKKSRRQDLVVMNQATVQIALPLLTALENAESAFFGLCVETGKQVLPAMMEHDRIAPCGPAGRHDAERQAVRAGSIESAIVLGGRRIGLRRPRVRSVERREVRLPSFEAAAKADPLDRHTLEAIASGVTMRRYGRSLAAACGGGGPLDLSELHLAALRGPGADAARGDLLEASR